jgi:hypothetical protein
MIFPGHKPQVVDLFSTNGTLLARNGAGVVLIPGQRTDLLPGDILLLSRGSALFHYMGTF